MEFNIRVGSRMNCFTVVNVGSLKETNQPEGHDRTALNWVTGRHIKNWYLQRAALAGYDGV